MSSFISALSLFILILSNGYLTLPINNEQLWNSTFSSLNNLTNEQKFNLRLVSENEISVFPHLDKNHPSDEHIGFEISTPVNNLSEENEARAPRTLDDFFTSEPTITTEKYFNDKRDYDDSFLTSSEPTTYTTEQSHSDKRDYDDLSFTTDEPTTQTAVLERRTFTDELETETDKREIQVELTTNDILLFTSTSSAVAPELYTTELLTSTSTEKYTGLLKYENEHHEEEEHEQEQSTKYMKTLRKTTKISKIQSEDQSEEDSKEPTAPIAVFDQEALNKIPHVPSDFFDT